MLAPLTRVLILALLGLSALLGFFFWRRQNVQAARGGRISPPKLAWLFYAIFLWFLLCPLVALDSAVHPDLRLVLGSFGAFMWLRGMAELYMLYVSYNWKPPYGIGHDVLCIVLVLGGLSWYQLHRDGPPSPLDVWALSLIALVLVSLIVEVMYATLFFQAVEGHTTGDDGIWFADEEQARFRRINRITLACNIPLYAGLGGLLAVALGFAV
ncbi:hypothetical protein ATI61_12534 [Archangium gephyra]|uniref:Uncharacterized protein n=1 Tax=Archangium gephyra TaxID=48 RepID=A0AAC8QJ36_9BACT|nr:hypothetical protein [Archangium gephyra]AKJ08304.1 Hypothetical protein AA314_09930 [Archangium gephyra]REG15408.1 hypothetical protein ATI61_12534 [Archangium gephyra]